MFNVTDGGCGCGCGSTVAPATPSNKRCHATVTPIAELLWLSGLDADNCEAFQRAVDVLSLRDCAGNVISSDTPVVLCEDFRDELCTAIAALAVAGDAEVGVTRLVGADCRLYTIPAGEFTETPNTVTDTQSLDLSATGPLGRNISGVVRISASPGNELELRTDGLFVPEPSVTVPTACQQIQAFGVGVDLSPGMQVIGSDCLKHTVPAPTQVTVTDSDTVDLTMVGQNLTADAVVDPDPDNLLVATGDGLLVSCASVRQCATPVTVVDTSTIDLTLTGQQLAASVIVSPDIANALESRPNGLYVDVCSALNDGLPPVPAVPLSTILVGADCNRYTVPSSTPITVVDTSCVNLSVSGVDDHTLTANVIVAPSQLLVCSGQGLSVPCEAVQDCVWTATNNFWSYDDINNAVYFRTSTDAGNQLGLGTDGLPFVPPSELTVDDTDCINLSLSGGGVLTASPIVSPTVGNVLTCTANGLFVPDSAIDVVGSSGQCVSVSVTESPVGTFTIGAVPVVSTDGGNVLECRPNGLYASAGASVVGEITDCATVSVTEAPPGTFSVAVSVTVDPDPVNALVCGPSGLFVDGDAPALLGTTCDGTEPSLRGLVLGTDVTGEPEWQNPGRTDDDVAAPGTLSQINDVSNRDSVFWISADIVLPAPTDRCSRYDIHIKNVDSVDHTVTAASLIDGQGAITLQGTSTGAYPFGNNGGESVHLFYSFSAGTWRVL